MNTSIAHSFSLLPAAALICCAVPACNSGKESPDDFLTEANQGDTAAQYRYGICALLGKGVQRKPDTAVRWLQHAASDLHPGASTVLGICYLTGTGIDKNERIGTRLLKRGAELRDPHACLTLAQLEAKKGDAEASQMWILKAAEYGSRPSEAFVVRELLRGNDMGISMKQSIDHLRYAAIDGIHQASYALFICYLNGIGVPPNQDLAIGWLETAADQGSPQARSLIRQLNRGEIRLFDDAEPVNGGDKES